MKRYVVTTVGNTEFVQELEFEAPNHAEAFRVATSMFKFVNIHELMWFKKEGEPSYLLRRGV